MGPHGGGGLSHLGFHGPLPHPPEAPSCANGPESWKFVDSPWWWHLPGLGSWGGWGPPRADSQPAPPWADCVPPLQAGIPTGHPPSVLCCSSVGTQCWQLPWLSRIWCIWEIRLRPPQCWAAQGLGASGQRGTEAVAGGGEVPIVWRQQGVFV